MTTEVETTKTNEEKLASTQSKMDTLRATIATKAQAGEDFTSETVEYAAAIAAHKGLFKSVNQNAIDEETSQVGQGLLTLVSASKLEALMGEPITSVYWTFTPGEGENGPLVVCGINVKARATKAPVAKGEGGGSRGRAAKETFSVDGGSQMTPKEFVTEHVAESDKENSLFTTGKWPTKPSFIDNAIKALEESGHSVIRTPVTE